MPETGQWRSREWSESFREDQNEITWRPLEVCEITGDEEVRKARRRLGEDRRSELPGEFRQIGGYQEQARWRSYEGTRQVVWDRPVQV